MTLPNKSSIDTYGGITRDAFPISDPKTEIGSDSLNPMKSDIAALTATAPRIIFQFKGGTSLPTLVFFDTVFGNGSGVSPVLGRTATGVFTFQFPAIVSDALGNTIALNLRMAEATAAGFVTTAIDGQFALPVCTITGSNTVNVTLVRASDATANDFAGVNINVKAW